MTTLAEFVRAARYRVPWTRRAASGSAHARSPNARRKPVARGEDVVARLVVAASDEKTSGLYK